jgi:hypothetical protein
MMHILFLSGDSQLTNGSLEFEFSERQAEKSRATLHATCICMVMLGVAKNCDKDWKTPSIKVRQMLPNVNEKGCSQPYPTEYNMDWRLLLCLSYSEGPNEVSVKLFSI